MKPNNELGEYLQSLRKERQLSLKEVAEPLGIDISMLSKIEKGVRKVQRQMIEPLASTLHVEQKSLNKKYISQRILEEFGEDPLLLEALEELYKSRIK
jgi:transcriptional regulator with XRE-family HTH domain